ncbi:carbohydrate kinase [Pontibacter korlensis]|uniref:Carbohydrate kinase n=1 Tax=Pontibacter korlensis TaxID=400092 RepID=A0A0E3ZBL8_9BACT|nr:carbohydrate kinase [Pontibacter korlensis]AKD02084.1 carbohydrate kinase [Pontibacter korlensis]
MKQPQIICFGEVLWDILPSGKMPGGAPMNVAIHLTYYGYSPVVISCVGKDDLARELNAFLQGKHLSTQWIQTSQLYQTGVVKANTSNKQEVTYEIVEPVAWDYVQYDEQAAKLIKASDVFIFGSLAARNSTSRKTLQQYLKLAKYKVLDVNLRPPYYSPELTQDLLDAADVAKMNHQELNEVTGWLGWSGNEQEQMQALKQHFNLQLLIVTRGDKGAAVLSERGYEEHQGYQVEVEDTIGSGDAFLATFLKFYLEGEPVSKALDKACMAGAFVATQKGATPRIDLTQIEKSFIKS